MAQKSSKNSFLRAERRNVDASNEKIIIIINKIGIKNFVIIYRLLSLKKNQI